MAEDELSGRIDFCQFTAEQRRLIANAKGRIADLLPSALDRFYRTAAQTPGTARFFRDPEHMARAKQAQLRHWQNLAEGTFDETYHASVRRIGERHAIIGLEPRWYVGAYILVIEDLIRGLGSRTLFGLGSNRALETVIAVVKAALIDMELSISVYFERSEAAQNQVVTALEQSLGRLAMGDMTGEIEEKFEPGYEPVRANFNSALCALRALVGSVTLNATEIDSSAGEIACASEDLARRTESNAANLEETTAAVAQMDDRLKAVASTALRTVDRANGATDAVAEGRATAETAVRAMSRVSESAKGIDGVIEGLDKIAFQTRVLAMNAAVEAGRAGEAGRGFAVVADLVSALAMRAEEEAGRAREQLTATQVDIISAVEMVEKVDRALAEISGDVGEVHALLKDIAADNQAQASAISEVSQALRMLDQTTQQNAAMVEETSAAARTLSTASTSLVEDASKFAVGGDSRSRAAGARPSTGVARSAPRHAAASNGVFAVPSNPGHRGDERRAV